MKRISLFAVFMAVLCVSADAAPVARGRAPVGGGGAAPAAASGAAPVSARAAVRGGASAASSGPAAVSARSATPVAAPAPAAVSARAGTSNAIKTNGTKVSEATANTVVSGECKDKYYGCMDSFCMLDNDNGGRCACSNRKSELDKVLADIEKLDQTANRMKTEGVDKINMGDKVTIDLFQQTLKRFLFCQFCPKTAQNTMIRHAMLCYFFAAQVSLRYEFMSVAVKPRESDEKNNQTIIKQDYKVFNIDFLYKNSMSILFRSYTNRHLQRGI